MTEASPLRIDFEPVSKTVHVENETRLLDAARKAGIDIPAACGGNRKCGTCRVKIVSGSVTEPTAEEIDLLSESERAKGYRLACCAHALGDLVIQLPRESMVGSHRLQIDGGDRSWQTDSIISIEEVEVPKPTLHDSRSDLGRITDVLLEKGRTVRPTADIHVVSQLSPLVREHEWRLNVMLRFDEIVGFTPPGSPALGMAVDMGTTKIAAYLLDLTTGKELASDGMLNTQTRHGDDIMSRLQYVLKNDAGANMAGLARKALNDLLHALAGRAKVDTRQVADVCVVGNTAITHMLLQLPVRQLATSPYVAATGAAVNVLARELGLDTAPGAHVHILPTIRGFVGADHVAMIIGTDIDKKDEICIGVDIGTNTEIVLRDPRSDSLCSTSCPSGPAFEGAHVASGMRASSGAIEAVDLSASPIVLKTINDEKPVGLCGSGIVDLMAEIYDQGIINDRGRFAADDPRVRKGEKGNEFLLSPAKDNGIEGDIVVNQKDVEEIQLAKGAIHAGIDILLEERQVAPEDVAQVYVAGAFGSYLDIAKSIAIGLLPYFPNAGYNQVGNTAAAGAIKSLLSMETRQRACDIARKAQYVELTIHPKFNRQFALGMLFPKKSDLKKA